jgi:hypothetical protein
MNGLHQDVNQDKGAQASAIEQDQGYEANLQGIHNDGLDGDKSEAVMEA